ncbi:hypothetical protein AQUCO_02800063v1 [Aquilegia coerulea]|uniref:GDSL esterase/lipase n=1 Tax=Aquilegia coerulea TaxID=218851 RepID=A0A2G5D3U1_AQUCA|nr:hypothetical protein AQUCO_02800063v1 [Aquilegia coerulea]
MTLFCHSTIPWFLLMQLILQVLQITAKVPAIIIFGDSSVDTGNNNQLSTVLKSNFKPYGRDFNDGKPTGRFSNGRVPGDFISEAFGIKPTVPAYLDPSYSIKDFATGVCFASAGTGYDNATSNVLDVMPLWKELEYYKEYQKKLRDYIGEEKADETLREALYIMSLGTNDFLENYYQFNSKRASEFTIKQYQDFLLGLAENFVKDLFNLGARKLSIGGLPPMGCLPLERMRNAFVGTGCNQEYNNVATEFNTKLEGLVVNLNKELPAAQIVHSNTYGILLNIIQMPSKYGFENAAVGCCATGMFEMGYMCNEFSPFTCADARKYVFWDSFHPTEKTSQIISDYVMRTTLATFM